MIRTNNRFKLTLKMKLCLGFLLLILAMAFSEPLLGLDPVYIHPEQSLLPPGSGGYWFGTDDLGRDLFARLAVGAQISLLIGFATALVAVVLGTLYGTFSAYFEGQVDTLMMRIIDVIYSLPGLMIVILFSVFFGRSVISLVLALALFSWPDTARIVRGQVLSLKREEFIEAYHSLGGDAFRLAWQHFLPNLMGMIILTTAMTVPRAILTESTLSFIGLGVEPPQSSWGSLASEGWQLVRVAPHMILFPGLLIFTTMVILNILGDTLREELEPQQ